MSVSKRLGAAAVAMLAASPAMAGDWDEAPLRGGYVHLGLSGIKQADEGNLWLGGMPISGADYATQFKTEVSIEAGYFFNDVFAVSAFGSVTASTPFLNDADALSLCTSTGSSMPRRNAP